MTFSEFYLAYRMVLDEDVKQIPIPWALVEYDTAFQTIVPDLSKEKRKGFISGARRNRISRERVFVKSYVQLDQSERDPQFRSNVLFIDRLVHPEYDGKQLIQFKNEYSGAIEPVEVILFPERGVMNDVQNLVMVLLSSMGARSLLQAKKYIPVDDVKCLRSLLACTADSSLQKESSVDYIQCNCSNS